ncbi:hypothetical protein JMJ35_005707 [Cladonia borealis]|uniref:J domain-containing protein n=1 Tax=Cladonia borealis TaxID=184061 RepID=A0AA39V1A5_9LECA|nr:hypothetical protein JMJ35_005707 [Cladonia borealis]
MARVQRGTFYDVLGISQDADHDAIKTAYKRMSRQCHPDKNLGNGHAVARQQAVNEAYGTLRDATSRRAYDAKLQPQRRVLNPFTPQYTWNGFDGAWGMPSSADWQPAGYSHFGQNTTAHDYWGGTQPWHESPAYDFKDPRDEERQEQDQGWGYNSWHESQPSEPGSFSWTEYEESWKQAEEERMKAEKEQEERANAERRRRREERRAERGKEQKRMKIARAPEKQKELSGKIVALDEEIARLKDILRRSNLTGEGEAGYFPDEEGSDTVDRFSIKLNHLERVLSEAISIHHNLCHVQRANGQADEAENAEQELAKARQVSMNRLVGEFVRADEEQRAGCASLNNPADFKTLEVNDNEERLRMQQRRRQTNQMEECMLQEQNNQNDAASGIRKPNGKRATFEHSDTQETWIRERGVYVLTPKPQEQADEVRKPHRKQLGHQRIYNWLDQVVENEENEAPGGLTAENEEHPDSRTRPTQVPHHLVDDNSETLNPTQDPCSSRSQDPHNVMDGELGPLIPDLSLHSSPPQASHKSFTGQPEPPISPPDQNISFPAVPPTPADSKTEPLISGLNSNTFEFNADPTMPNYLRMVHNRHLEVHSEFWDFVLGDEANCDLCGVVPSVLQCPNCNATACSGCKANPAGRSYLDPKNGYREGQYAAEACDISFSKGKGLGGRY